MIRHNYFFYLIFIFLFSCGEDKKQVQEDVAEDSIATVQPISLPEKSNNLIKTDSGLFRGIEFGMTIEEVKSKEDPSLLGDDTLNYLNYLITFNVNEEADVLYYFNQHRKISRIEVNIYPENIDSQTELFDEFASYYDKKFGNASSINASEKIWTTADKRIIIVIKKTGNEKVHDIKIDFRPANAHLPKSST